MFQRNFGPKILGFCIAMSVQYLVWAQQEKAVVNIKAGDGKISDHVISNDSTYQKLFTTSNKWKLIQINGKKPVSDSAFIILDRSTGTFSGNNGCNNIAGQYEIKKGKITFSKIMATLMICENDKNNQLEKEFSKLLNAPFEFDIADQTLNLYRDNKLVLMFGIVRY